MKKLAVFLIWMALIALIAALPWLYVRLPVTNDGVAARLSDDWSGVLRVWICEDMWKPGNGSFIPWLNACAGRFERRNPGVYVQATVVSLETMRGFADGGVNPPDLVLLAPGMLENTENLLPLEDSALLPDALNLAGGGYASAVALGGYGWALNRTYLAEAPTDWAALGDPTIYNKKKQRDFSWMDVPADAAFSSYSSAFLSLLTDRYEADEPETPVKAGEGLDLSLPEDAQPTPTPRPQKRVSSTLPLKLPKDFRTRQSVLSDFLSGRTGAVLATQREMKRLETLSGAGRAPDWTLSPAPYTDQIAFLAVIDLDRADLAARQALAVSLIEFLQSDDSQKALSAVRAFRAVPGDALYPYQTGFAQLERALSAGVRYADAFDAGFRTSAKSAADAHATQNGGT